MVRILYEDDQLLLAEKPVGVLSEPSPGGADLLTLLSAQTGAALFPVHRLDKGTGGVMLLAKSSACAAALSERIRQGDVTKEYLAVVRGTPDPPAGEMTDLLFRDAAANKTYVVRRMRRGVREAKLAYEVRQTAGPLALVRVRLMTGRTHQVRVQFASRRLPLVGDARYGGRDGRCAAPALWSSRVGFTHPVTGAPVAGVSPPPRQYPWDLFEEMPGDE